MESLVRVDWDQVGNGEDGQGQAYRVPNTDQRVKVRIRNRKVMEMKHGSLEAKMGRGEVRVGVLVQGCTECNKLPNQYAINVRDNCLDCFKPK